MFSYIEFDSGTFWCMPALYRFAEWRYNSESLCGDVSPLLQVRRDLLSDKEEADVTPGAEMAEPVHAALNVARALSKKGLLISVCAWWPWLDITRS